MLKYELPPPDIDEHPVPELADPSSRPKLIFNWEDWIPYLEEMELTEAQQRQFIETYWLIVSIFVDLRWEIVSEAENCEQNLDLTAALMAAVLQSQDHQQTEEV
ncbi:MAG: hypothetical protein AAF441_24890 [Pseudomonadota bacterium]